MAGGSAGVVLLETNCVGWCAHFLWFGGKAGFLAPPTQPEAAVYPLQEVGAS